MQGAVPGRWDVTLLQGAVSSSGPHCQSEGCWCLGVPARTVQAALGTARSVSQGAVRVV